MQRLILRRRGGALRAPLLFCWGNATPKKTNGSTSLTVSPERSRRAKTMTAAPLPGNRAHPNNQTSRDSQERATNPTPPAQEATPKKRGKTHRNREQKPVKPTTQSRNRRNNANWKTKATAPPDTLKQGTTPTNHHCQRRHERTQWNEPRTHRDQHPTDQNWQRTPERLLTHHEKTHRPQAHNRPTRGSQPEQHLLCNWQASERTNPLTGTRETFISCNERRLKRAKRETWKTTTIITRILAKKENCRHEYRQRRYKHHQRRHEQLDKLHKAWPWRDNRGLAASGGVGAARRA